MAETVEALQRRVCKAYGAEYTPPVIYSLETRDKLVFLVEAVPSNPRALVPGQPIDVAPTAEALPRR